MTEPASAAPGDVAPTELRSSAAKGVMWTGLGQVLRQVVAFGTQIALARLLAPEAFGLVAMMTIASELAMLFADFGIGSAIVQRRQIDRKLLSTCFWLNLGIAAACAVALIGAGPFMASYFGHTELIVLTMIAGFNLLVNGAMVIPQAVLMRRMHFRQLTVSQTIGSLTGSFVAIAAALMGAGVWSLAVQPVLGSFMALLLMARAAQWHPDFSMDKKSIRSLVNFGGNLLGANVLGFVGRNMHSFLIGKSLGSASLGIYNMAQTIAYMPAYQVSVVVQKVLFPTLSRLQDDRPGLRSAYLRAVGAVALCTFPMMMGLYATAEDLVPVVLGPDWLPMVVVLKIVSWAWMIQSVGTIAGTILVSIGETRLMFRAMGLTTVLTVISLLIGIRGGLLGVAIAASLATAVSYAIIVVIALARIELPLLRYLATLMRPFAAAVGMTIIVLVIKHAMSDVTPMIRLGACVLGGVFAYLGWTLVLNREQALDLVKFAKSARG